MVCAVKTLQNDASYYRTYDEYPAWETKIILPIYDKIGMIWNKMGICIEQFYVFDLHTTENMNTLWLFSNV